MLLRQGSDGVVHTAREDKRHCVKETGEATGNSAENER